MVVVFLCSIILLFFNPILPSFCCAAFAFSWTNCSDTVSMDELQRQELVEAAADSLRSLTKKETLTEQAAIMQLVQRVVGQSSSKTPSDEDIVALSTTHGITADVARTALLIDVYLREHRKVILCNLETSHIV